MPSDFIGKIGPSSGAMQIIGLNEQYSKSNPVEVTVSVSDPLFDCGDLYITIYDVSKIPKEAVTQSGFFGQCYAKSNLVMPIDEKFSEIVDTPGQYEIVSEINDEEYKNSLTKSEKFIVR